MVSLISVSREVPEAAPPYVLRQGEASLAEEEGDEDLGVEEVVAGGDDFGLGAGEGDLGVGAFEDAGFADVVAAGDDVEVFLGGGGGALGDFEGFLGAGGGEGGGEQLVPEGLFGGGEFAASGAELGDGGLDLAGFGAAGEEGLGNGGGGGVVPQKRGAVALGVEGEAQGEFGVEVADGPVDVVFGGVGGGAEGGKAGGVGPEEEVSDRAWGAHNLVARREKGCFPMIGKLFSNGWKISAKDF